MASIFEKQRKKSNYTSPKESKEIVHKLLHTEGLDLDVQLRKFMEFMWNCDYGVTKASEKKISEIMTKKMGKGYGFTTMKTGIRLAKEHGLIIVKDDDERSKYGQRLCAFKILAPVETIEAFIQANLKTEESDHKVDHEVDYEVDHEVDHWEKAEIPCDSKDESQKIESDKTVLSYINQNKILNNNRYKNDEEITPSKKGFYKDPKIHPEVSEVVNMFPWNELSPNLVANELQLALNHTKTEITEENHGKLYEAVGNVWRKVEKKKKSLRDPNKIYKFINTCFITSLQGFFTEVKIENGVKVTHEHHHYHHKEKQKSFASMLMNSESDKTFDDIFGTEEKPERKEINPEFTPQGKSPKKPIRTELLPDWFDKSPIVTPESKVKSDEEKAETRKEIEEMCKQLDIPMKSTSLESSMQA